VAATSTYAPDELLAWAEFHEKIETRPAEEREVFELLWYQDLSQAESSTADPTPCSRRAL
jgi:DNA-directed RNA polymerase specialized sigma24 family protein